MPIYYFNYKQKNKIKGFQKVKDLVRGTITTDVEDLRLAYEHFGKTPGVRIVAIKNRLK